MDTDIHRCSLKDETHQTIRCAMEIFNNLCLSVSICGSKSIKAGDEPQPYSFVIQELSANYSAISTPSCPLAMNQ